MQQFKLRGRTHASLSDYRPLPGDILAWWKVCTEDRLTHVELVHQLHDGMCYTIERNKSPKLQGFSYVASCVDKLLELSHAQM